MRNKRKVLLFVLAALMSLSGFSTGVSAADGDSTPTDVLYDTYTQDSDTEEWSLLADYDAASVPSLFSMMPLEETSLYLNIDGYLPAELEKFPFSKLLELLREKYPYYDFGAVQAVTDRYEGAGDDFVIADEDLTLDLSADSYYEEWNDHYHYYQLVTGENADQLNTSNNRYILSIYVNNSGEDILYVAEAVNSSRESLEITDNYVGTSRYSSKGQYIIRNYLETSIYEKEWPEDDMLYFRLQMGSDFAETGLTATIYEGYYESEEDIPEDAENVTAQLLTENSLTESGGYLLRLSETPYEFTAVFQRNGETVDVFPFFKEFYPDSISLSYSPVYAENDSGYRSHITSYTEYRTLNGLYTRNITLDPGYPANGIYYFNLYMYHPTKSSESGCGVEFVEKAVLGDYQNAEDILSEELTDIKAELFSYASSSGGYAADYSAGVTFSILDIEGNVYRRCIKTQEYLESEEETLPPAPRPLSADTYFRASGAYIQREDGSHEWLSSYVMPYEADTYYYNGYQTVFVLDEDENGNYIPVAENSTVYPYFYTGSKVHMYASHDATAGDLQTSGETESNFQSGAITAYSAAAENGTHLKNYWVTYLTQQNDPDAPKLFINGANDETRYITADGEEIYQRELFLVDAFDNYHDIFFANIGSEDLEGMYVRLENPVNIALDEYWTVTEGSSLSAFTTTENRDKNNIYTSYGDLANFGKVRIRADLSEGNSAYGAVSGTLVIGYTGSGEGDGEEYRIALTGIAADPQVTTDTLADAVKYVPYSQLIMTNNMYDNDKVRFDIVSGRLPDGVELRPNGEIYGLPTQVGTYTFEVEITFTSDVYGMTITDTREYTINVLDNTDANVFWTNETDNQGYEFVEPDESAMVGLPNLDHEILYHVWLDEDSYVEVELEDLNNFENFEIVDEYELELFWSEGPHDEQFMYFFLDGNELVSGVDYTSEEGSTKINIQSQTFRDAGEGHHTIAAEFRTGHTDDGIMRRTSQNVYIHNVSSDVPSAPGTPSTPDSSYLSKILSDIQDFVRNQKREEDEGKAPIESNSVSTNKQHSITFVQNEGGTVKSSYLQAIEGTLVTITVAPIDGFVLQTIEAVSNTEVYLNKISDTEYTFTMPGDPVEIRTVFESVEIDLPDTLPFFDVPKGEWFFDSIAYVSSRGLMNGTSSTSFLPNVSTSRAMLVTVLYRMAGEPENTTASSFADVAKDSYYADAVAWATETGIVEGYSVHNFGTDDPVTREQVATILYRYAVHVGRDTSAANMLINFLDADQISAYAVPALEWANAEGLILGMTENTLNPSGEATRAQIAAILARFSRGE